MVDRILDRCLFAKRAVPTWRYYEYENIYFIASGTRLRDMASVVQCNKIDKDSTTMRIRKLLLAIYIINHLKNIWHNFDKQHFCDMDK